MVNEFPREDQLTIEMQKCMKYGSDFVCTGVPGTGKTVVAFYKFKNLVDQGFKVKMICYNRLLATYLMNINPDYAKDIVTINSLYGTMQNQAKERVTWFSDSGRSKNERVLRKYVEKNGKYDWIIIDEGQDLGRDFYEYAHILADNVGVFMDDHQRLDKNAIEIGELENQLSKSFGAPVKPFTLTKIFRSPSKVFNMARNFLPNDLAVNDPALIETLRDDENSIVKEPELIGQKELPLKIADIVNKDYPEKSIGIFVQDTGSMSKINMAMTDLLGDKRRDMVVLFHGRSNNITDWNGKVLLTNYACAKGLEFDTIIIVSPSKDDDFIANKLFVLSTRSKQNLYIYINEDE